MSIVLQNPDLDRKLRTLATETGRPVESLAEEALTSYFDAAAAIGAELEQRLHDIEEGRVEAIDGQEAFRQIRERGRKTG